MLNAGVEGLGRRVLREAEDIPVPLQFTNYR